MLKMYMTKTSVLVSYLLLNFHSFIFDFENVPPGITEVGLKTENGYGRKQNKNLLDRESNKNTTLRDVDCTVSSYCQPNKIMA